LRARGHAVRATVEPLESRLLLSITLNGFSYGTVTTGATSLTWSDTVAAGTDRAMFVELAIDGLGALVTGVTYGGVALTQVGRATGNHASEIWRLVNPTVGTANIVASFGGTTAAAGGTVTFNGVDQSNPTGTFVGNAGTSATMSVTAASAAGDTVIDVEHWTGSAPGYTLGNGQTYQWAFSNSTLLGASTTAAGAPSVTMSSTVSTSAEWDMGAVSIHAATTVASQVAYSVQPSNATAGVADSPSIVVDVEDQFGSIVTTDNSNVTLSVASGPGVLTGTATVAASSGVATFSNVKLNTAGAYTLTASDGSLTTATSNSFTVSAAAASKLAYSVQPSNVTAGVADSPSIVVDVEDPFGNIVTTNSSNVTLAVASGPGVLSGTATVAASSGVATFNNVKLNTAGAYTLTASDGSLTTATSNGFTVSAAAASKLAYSVQPSNVTAGVADSPSIVVDVEDPFGNIVTTNSSNVTLSVASGPGVLSGTATVAASSGIAAFSNVKLDTPGAYTLTASDGSLTSATSNGFTVSAAAASKVVYSVQPSNVTAGVADSPSIVVDVEDQFGNIVTTNSSSVTLAVASGPGVLTGTATVAASSGVATFSNVKLNTAGVYTLTASDGSLTSATSNGFTVNPAAASKLVYAVQPSNVAAGVADSPSIVVDVEDQFGNIVTSNSSNVTLAVASGPGVLTGTATVAASSGVATFSNVKLNTAGNYTLTASDGSLTSATSNSFTVSAAVGSKVAFTQQPTNVQPGNAISPAVTVSVEDAFGNVIASNGSSITISLASGPGVLSGTLTVAAVNGVATFSNLRLNATGSYTLNATDGSLTSGTSAGFTVGTATTTQVAFVQQPTNVNAGSAESPSIVVDVEDQFGNIVTTDHSNVTLSVASGPGSLTGTATVAASNGAATFSNVKLDTPGNYTLTASDGSLTSATSNGFTVSAAAASKLVYAVQPSNVTAGVADSPSIVVDVEDRFGNIVTADNSNVTLSVASGPGGLSGTVTVAASNGVATFSNVTLDTAGTHTLTASDGSLTSATSNGFTVSVAAASKVVYSVQPSNVTVGVADSPSIIVEVEDPFGNVITTDSSNVTLAVAGGPGSLSGTVTVAASNGVATFSNIILDTAGNYTLMASDGSLTSATSSSFTVAMPHVGPTIAVNASATPSPVGGTTTNLSVLGAYGGGESVLTYTWSATAQPTGSNPLFSVNGTNAAKNSTVTFNEAGSYTFTCTISDGQGGTVTSSTQVTVNQTLSSVAIVASPAQSVRAGGELFLTAVQSDQFSRLMAQQLPVAWSVDSGNGTVGSDGIFIASDQSGTVEVRATLGQFSNTIAVTVWQVAAPILVSPTNPVPSIPPVSPGSNGGESTILQGSGGSGSATPVQIEQSPQYGPTQATDPSNWIPDASQSVTPTKPPPQPDNGPADNPVQTAPNHAAPAAALARHAAAAPKPKQVPARAPAQSGPIEITPINRTAIIQELMHGQSDEWDQDMVRDARLKLRVGVASAIGSAAASAYLLWLIRGGGVLASLLSSAPVWKLVDPLFVLPSRRLYRAIWKRPRRVEREDPEDRFFGRNSPR